MTVSNESRPAAVYRLYDAAGTLLYIGSAYDPEARCKEHQKKEWWPEVAHRTEEWFGHRNTAYRKELKAIGAERSKYNAMGTPRYQTPQTEKVRHRNALARTRSLLIGEARSVKWEISVAAREAGYSITQAERMGTLAEIEFLERTGLFAASVKRRRAQFAATGRA